MKKTIKTIVAIFLLLCLTVCALGCAGCGSCLVWILQKAEFDFNDFLSYEEGDVYTCQVNDDTSFWYSPQDCYGEWKRGKTVLPIMISRNYGVPALLDIHFFDFHGCRIGVLGMWMDDSRFGSDSTAEEAKCQRLKDTKILNADYEQLLQTQFADLVWEGVTIKKIKKEVTKHDSSVQPLLSWAKTASDEVMLCETGNFWFSIESGYGYWKDGSVKDEWMKFQVKQKDDNYATFDLSYMQLEISNGKDYEIFADEEGYYIWLGTKEEPVKAYLTKATEENDPRRAFKAFFQAEDAQQNAYTFTCEQGNFSYSGSLGLGIWQTEAGPQNIKVSLGKYPFEICISTISNTAESEVLLKADFVEMTDENTAKFKIRSEYFENEIFYAEDQPILYTEFSIVKHGSE